MYIRFYKTERKEWTPARRFAAVAAFTKSCVFERSCDSCTQITTAKNADDDSDFAPLLRGPFKIAKIVH